MKPQNLPRLTRLLTRQRAGSAPGLRGISKFHLRQLINQILLKILLQTLEEIKLKLKEWKDQNKVFNLEYIINQSYPHLI